MKRNTSVFLWGSLAAAIALTAVRGGAIEPAAVYPGAKWATAAPREAGLDEKSLQAARDYALTGDGSGIITRGGRVVMTWGDQARRYDLKSTTKSIGVTALGLAIMDGKIHLDDKAQQHQPEIGRRPVENQKTGWLEKITIEHLATQTAGFEKPGGYTRLLFEPGTKWDYSDSGPNWLAECVTRAYKRDVRDLLFERVFTPIGIDEDDLRWRNNAYREKTIDGVPRREFGSGVSANVDAMARIGYLYLRRGRWRDRQRIPAEFVDLCRTTPSQLVGLPEHHDKHGNASDHYGLLWWNNADGTLADVPRDAYWSWGLYDSLIVVIPSLDIVAARAGRSWKREKQSRHYDVLAPFLTSIAKAVEDTRDSGDEEKVGRNNRRAVPASTPRDGEAKTRVVEQNEDADATDKDATEVRRVIGIEFAPKQSIVRLARGSDNWPMTWGDDDAQYTAYGDGWGFKPRVERKLSVGLARVAGTPDDPHGENIRSETLEDLGGGASGRKASGMLMVDGVLYVLMRNADNAQLGWSRDHGKTWTWADWRFTTSFGCPTFLNFGRNYAGARDDYVYIYSFDSDSAYRAADRMVLARVPREQITDRAAYEFFVQIDDGRAEWSGDIARRGAVLSREGECYRGGVTYNTPLKTYLWAMLPGGATAKNSRLAVYAADEPWGPWREIFSTDDGDVDPGETASFPTKWISDDGRTVHLLFSGDDSFSVRRATLRLAN